MEDVFSGKPAYDLEERTFVFAKNVRFILKKIKRCLIVEDDIKQLIRASGSVGANYIEANESLSKKDFVYRVKICRKEAKESAYWSRLLLESIEPDVKEKMVLIRNEAVEL